MGFSIHNLKSLVKRFNNFKKNTTFKFSNYNLKKNNFVKLDFKIKGL